MGRTGEGTEGICVIVGGSDVFTALPTGYGSRYMLCSVAVQQVHNTLSAMLLNTAATYYKYYCIGIWLAWLYC